MCFNFKFVLAVMAVECCLFIYSLMFFLVK